jgi:hypothetical protein
VADKKADRMKLEKEGRVEKVGHLKKFKNLEKKS